jgi:tripartite-type tricarboxylate transporter receptor subunit TctC
MGAGGDRRRRGGGLSIVASEPIRLVIGFSPGSASHDAALLLAPRLEEALHRRVVFEWEHGDSGARAARRVAAAHPDGATLLICTLGTHALRPKLPPPCGYDPLTDFAPIGLLMQAPLVLAASPKARLGSVAALLAAARAAPGALTYASSAEGGAPHLAGALFATSARVQLRHRIYSDTRVLYADLESGAVALSFNNVASMAGRLAEGTLVGLATTGGTRHPDLPGLPTLAETGIRGYAVTNWVGLAAPAGTPASAVAAVAAAAGVEPRLFAEHLRSEVYRWRDVAALLDGDS